LSNTLETWAVHVNGQQVGRYSVKGKADIKARMLRREGSTNVFIVHEQTVENEQ